MIKNERLIYDQEQANDFAASILEISVPKIYFDHRLRLVQIEDFRGTTGRDGPGQSNVTRSIVSLFAVSGTENEAL